jgi:hypothetical protein
MPLADIGDTIAAASVAKIVDFDRVTYLDNYFGIFPEENTSGVDKGTALKARDANYQARNTKQKAKIANRAWRVRLFRATPVCDL